MLGGAAQGNLAQRDQVALAEEVLRRLFGLARRVDFAGSQAGGQFVGGHVDQDNLVCSVQYFVGHCLMHADAGDGTNGAIEAFQMLNVERGPNVNASVQQFLHVLPALGVA